MAWQNNQTSGRSFLLSDLLQGPSAPRTFFALSLLELLAALLGSTTMITLIRAHPHLHSPTYFLLGQLSLMDLLYISTFVPKMALDFLSGDHLISFFGCSTQMFLFTTLMGSECLLLAVMAYDRYVAICHPLHYPIRIRPKVCTLLVLTSWLGALLNALIHVIYTLNLPYCASREIHHFFCEIPALLKLVCILTLPNMKKVFLSAV